MTNGKPYRVVHYLNQFFGGLGGEEKAGAGLVVREGPVGPGLLLQKAVADWGEVIATFICGDDFINEQLESVGSQIISHMESYRPDLVLAGPAFDAGRYGVACGKICQLAKEKLAVAAITGMNKENPGVDLFQASIPIVCTEGSAREMEKAIHRMAKIARKLVTRQHLGPAHLEGYFPTGVRKNWFHSMTGAERAVEMLLKKINGAPFETELPFVQFDWVPPAPGIKTLESARIALVTTSGVVPKGNPDRLERSRTTKVCKYSLEGLDDLTFDSHEIIHAGYDIRSAAEDPDRVLPLDVMRALEKENLYGTLHPIYYVVSGQGAYMANAQALGQQIAGELSSAAVEGVILTST